MQVPHINQEKGLFLRGGPHYLCGKSEEDSIKDHQHTHQNLDDSDVDQGSRGTGSIFGTETKPSNFRVRFLMKTE